MVRIHPPQLTIERKYIMAANVDSTVRELVYEFLDDLRESGTVNMFGATPMPFSVR